MIPQNEQQWYDQWQRADELETIFHVFSNMARTETNQKFMTKYERIANSAINERARISPNYISERYSQ
tara:strand:+ start:717 stop:920 length:204 start_codon:yes stop_codon:yes gene_type:complete